MKAATCGICKAVIKEEIPIKEHTAGEWKATKKATIYESGERTQSCTQCKKVLASEEYELTGEAYVKAYKDSCKKYKYKTIAREPEKYKGKLAKFTGEVVQVMESGWLDALLGNNTYTLRVNVTKSGSYYSYYKDTVYVTYEPTDGEPKILEGDIITMYGELDGDYTYSTVLGSSVTVPAFIAKYIKIK